MQREKIPEGKVLIVHHDRSGREEFMIPKSTPGEHLAQIIIELVDLRRTPA